MSNLAKKDVTPAALEKVLISGDLSVLNEKQRIDYYGAVCKSVGLNPLTKPFEYIKLNNKLVLYALRGATDQLRKNNGVSINISSRDHFGDIYVVTAKAKDKDGREDEATGAVNIAGLKGDALANAFMKAETKAKRRVTLSICGLGMLDETEVETIPATKDVSPTRDHIAEAKAEQKAVEVDPGEYVVGFGKFKGQRLKDIIIHDLASYVSYIEQKAQEDNKPIRGQVAEFLKQAHHLIELRTPDASDELFETDDEEFPDFPNFAPGAN